jgi:hypothetical protein
MIRIDENTYIDDTLVTCAEYQLFIDEMRKQGKYYQPDHWTSYRFPVKQARTPVVGVRLSAAKAFCEWLIKRELREWSYRLPTSVEADQFPLTDRIQSPLGYWTEGLKDKVGFSWIGSTPVNPKKIDINLARARAHELARAPNRGFNRSIDSAIGRAFDRAFDLDIAIDRSFAIARDTDFDPNRIFSKDSDLDIAHNLDLDSAFAFDRNIDRALIRATIRASKRANNSDQDSDLPREPNSARKLDLDLDLFIDLFTLQERIAGRSPAFEGIRLVKERKKP